MSSAMSVDYSNISSLSSFNSTLSLYIPSVPETITVDNIKLLFGNKIGVISHIDFVYNTKGTRQAFVHFSMWFITDYTKDLQAKILDSKSTAMISTDETVKNSFGNNNIILLPNRNPRDKPNEDIINNLQDRIKQLENKFLELSSKDLSVEANGKRSRHSP